MHKTIPLIVNALDLTGKVTAPVKGAAPVTTFSETDQYTGVIAWQTADGAGVSGNFAAETVYRAVLTLTAKTGFTFTSLAADTFTYTGAASVTNAANSGTVTISFPATTGDPAPALMAELQKLGNTTADNPGTVVLSAITIDKDDEFYTSDWGRVDEAVQSAEKYVILDLSNCTFPGNEVASSYTYNNGIAEETGMSIIKDNEYIKGIILPESVTYIGNDAFENCSGLTSVTFEGGSISSIAFFGSNAFRYSGNETHNELRELYLGGEGGAGTYERDEGQNNWRKV